MAAQAQMFTKIVTYAMCAAICGVGTASVMNRVGVAENSVKIEAAAKASEKADAANAASHLQILTEIRGMRADLRKHEIDNKP